jgi:hypothetical protein
MGAVVNPMDTRKALLILGFPLNLSFEEIELSGKFRLTYSFKGKNRLQKNGKGRKDLKRIAGSIKERIWVLKTIFDIVAIF